MKKRPERHTDPLRQRAERLLTPARPALLDADAQKLIQELEIHQIELELQNEELRKTRLEAEANLERYTELYDFAPVGYVTLSREGIIRQANLTAAKLLGINRGKLTGQRMGRLVADLPSFNSFLASVFRSQVRESCEVMLSATSTTRRTLRIEATLAESGEVCRAMLTDISENRLLQERLDRFVRFSMDQVAQAAYLIGTDARIQDVNETTSRMLGYSRTELLGMPFWNVEPSLRPETWLDYWHEVQELGTMTYESIHRGKSGQAFPVEIDVTSMSYQGVNYCCALARDITRQKEAEAALKKSHAQLRTSVEQAPICIAMLDRNLNYLATSRRWIEEYGRGYDELIGRNHYEIHPDVPEEWKKIHRDALAGAFLKNDEDLWVQADGSRHWMHWAVYPWTNETGETGGIIISAEDITKNKQAQEALRASEQRLSGLISSATDAIIAVDAKHKIVLFNPAAERVFGISRGDIIGQPLDRLLPQSVRSRHAEHIEAFARSGVTSRSMKTLDPLHGLRANGEEFPIEASISQIDLPGGKLFTVILRDITERKKAEQALLDADQRKNEFLALLAHELRNPLAVTATAAYLLQTKGLSDPEKCRWAAATITSQTEILKRMVDDLLDAERVSRGRVALLKTPLDLGQLMAQVVKEREPCIEQRKQHFIYSPPSRPVWVDGDPARLIQVITNLLDNATKFTPGSGRIELSLEQEGSEAVIRVRDNGRGISPNLLPHVFEIFTQGHVPLARDEGGLGLGLALVKGLTELHGGRVTAASEGHNKGAEFTVHLPALAGVEPAAPDSGAQFAEMVARKRRILVVEDNAMAAEGLRQVLQDAGHDVRLAVNGAEALEAAKEKLPEIAIIDIGLPVIDGYELAQRLRTLPEADRLLLIALTGYGQEKDRLQSKRAGFGYHFLKPADLRQLLEIINNWNAAEQP
jgi:two-component system CheB/CheR fusion protein